MFKSLIKTVSCLRSLISFSAKYCKPFDEIPLSSTEMDFLLNTFSFYLIEGLIPYFSLSIIVERATNERKFRFIRP